jgi:hypothetical protein
MTELQQLILIKANHAFVCYISSMKFLHTFYFLINQTFRLQNWDTDGMYDHGEKLQESREGPKYTEILIYEYLS